MATQFWLRNPQRSIRQALVEGQEHFVFDQALVNYRRQSPHSFMREHFSGTGLNPQFVVVGNQGARWHDLFTEPDTPKAVWPVWTSEDGLEVLETYLGSPHGEDVMLCTDETIEQSVRPVWQQPHRVFIRDVKYPNDPLVAKMIGEIRQLFYDYPDAESHVSGSNAFSYMFGHDWDHADWSTDFHRQSGGLQLPNGWNLGHPQRAEWDDYSDWIELLGWSMDKLSRLELVQFHIRSARWAAENYNTDVRYKRRYSPSEDDIRNTGRRKPPRAAQTSHNNWRKAKKIATRSLPMFDSADGDKAICNHCVHRTSCPLARADMVCAIEGTEMGDLARQMGTRNADVLIDGMLRLLSAQTERMEEAVANERMSGESDPEVTRQMNSVFKNAGTVAKLIDPNLNGKGTTITNQTLNVNGVPTLVPSNDPRQVMSAIVKELELAGIPRDQITGDMIAGILAQQGSASSQQAIEGAVVQNTSAKE